jgi:hypothetical protein
MAELQQQMVKLELVKKLPTKMYKFHQYYMKMLAKGREMIGMLVRPEDFSSEDEKVI